MPIETPEFIIEIFLHPSEFYWGDSDTRIKTILGSCVALCLWNPVKKIGGMSHSLLPKRSEPVERLNDKKARYVDEAVEMFLHEIKKSKTNPSDYKVLLFGGGNMFEEKANLSSMRIGERNIEQARISLKENGFRVESEQVGGNLSRNVVFDLWSGTVQLKKI